MHLTLKDQHTGAETIACIDRATGIARLLKWSPEQLEETCRILQAMHVEAVEVQYTGVMSRELKDLLDSAGFSEQRMYAIRRLSGAQGTSRPLSNMPVSS